MRGTLKVNLEVAGGKNRGREFLKHTKVLFLLGAGNAMGWPREARSVEVLGLEFKDYSQLPSEARPVGVVR